MHNRFITALLAAVFALSATAAEPAPTQSSSPVPYPTLNPPSDVSPALTRGWFPKSAVKLPPRVWTPEERTQYEQRVKWFHEAKFGLFYCYLSFGAGLNNFPDPGFKWTSEKWNAWVDAVDVEKAADQAKELGAGFVILTLGQNHLYSCAPNPVLDALWGVKPGRYTSRRDLPMDLCKALEKRGIPMMLYVSTDSHYRLPVPPKTSKAARFNNWVKVCQGYSDHYGKNCKGWWVDGLIDHVPGYSAAITKALKHGNPDALVASGVYELSDFQHGHCIPPKWDTQQRMKPYYGRWDPEYKIQSQVLLTVGKTWGYSGAPKKTKDLVNYAADIVKGGGVITFDVGMYRQTGKKQVGPYLEIQPDQFAQLKAVRDALKNIPASDGSGK